jgi:hypothetical protein
LLLDPATDVSDLAIPPAYKLQRDIYDQLNVFCLQLGLRIIRSKTEKNGRTVYELALAEVQSDNDFSLVELAAHPQLSTAGIILVTALYKRFGSSGGRA